MQSDEILKKYHLLFEMLRIYDETGKLPFQKKRIDLTLSIRTIDKLEQMRKETGTPISNIIDSMF